MKLKKIIENLDQKMELNEKAAFLEEVSKFNEYGKTVYRMEGMREAAQAINNLVEKAQRVALQETEEWFDEVTIKRNMKGLCSNNEIFQKTVREIATLQQRAESLYEEMGSTLSRYFEIKGLEDKPEQPEAQLSEAKQMLREGDGVFALNQIAKKFTSEELEYLSQMQENGTIRRPSLASVHRDIALNNLGSDQEEARIGKGVLAKMMKYNIKVVYDIPAEN